MAKEEKDKPSKGPKGAKPSDAEIAARKAAKRAKTDTVEDIADEAPAAPAPPPRLIAHYREKIVPELQQKFGYKNNLAVPRLEKIVISMGIGKYATAGGEGK